MIWIEAESVTPESPLAQGGDAAASGGAFISTPDAMAAANESPMTAGGRVTYRLVLPRCSPCVIWGRTQTPDSSGDSFWVSVDGGPFTKWNDLAAAGTGWEWETVRDSDAVPVETLQYDLGPGTHELVLVHREDGAMLDELLITNDLTFTPSGLGD